MKRTLLSILFISCLLFGKSQCDECPVIVDVITWGINEKFTLDEYSQDEDSYVAQYSTLFMTTQEVFRLVEDSVITYLAQIVYQFDKFDDEELADNLRDIYLQDRIRKHPFINTGLKIYEHWDRELDTNWSTTLLFHKGPYLYFVNIQIWKQYPLSPQTNLDFFVYRKQIK